MGLSDFEEDFESRFLDSFLSELKGRIKDEMGELMVNGGEGAEDGGQSDLEGDGDLGGRPSLNHRMLPPSLMNGFNGVDDARNRY